MEVLMRTGIYVRDNEKEKPLPCRGFHMRGGGGGAESNICRYKSLAKHFPTRNKIKVKKN